MSDLFEITKGRPLPLITHTPQQGFQIAQEAQDFLQSIKTKVAVISVAGKYRTGKSFLLNRVILNLQNTPGFGVGPTINPCTKGIWVWNQPIYTQTQEGEDLAILILDTEGLGAFDEDANHDTRIFMLALLLGSFFIYNSVGSIDESALQTLSLVVNLTKQLQVRANDSSNDVDEISEYFPSFLWVLRDFMLRLVDNDGSRITPKQYLENALKPQKGLSDSIQSKNRIRKLLVHFFKDRDCFTMVRPTEDEQALQNLMNIDSQYLRPEFIQQVDQFRRMIFRKVKPKTINNRAVNGEMLLGLAQAYTDAINRGTVPTIEGAWTSVCNFESQKLIQELSKEYEEFLKSLTKENVLGDQELMQSSLDKQALLLQTFKQQSIGDSEQFEIQMKQKFDQVIKVVKQQNDRKCVQAVEKKFKDVIQPLIDQVRKGEVKEIEEFKGMFDEIIEEFNQSSVQNQTALGKVKEISNRIFQDAIDMINRKKITEQQNENKRLQEQINFIQHQMDSKKEGFQSEKQQLEQKIESLQTDLNKYKGQSSVLQEKLSNLEQEKQKLIQSTDQQLDEANQGFKDRYSNLKEKFQQLREENSNLKSELNTTQVNFNREQALTKQQLEFKAKDVTNLQQKLDESSSFIKQLKKQNEKLKQQIKKSSKENTQTDIQVNNNWGMEKNFMESQIDQLKQQLQESKSIQETLLQAINKNKKSGQKYDPTRHLSIAIEKLEQRNQYLETKADKYKALKLLLQDSNGLQCKYCNMVKQQKEFQSHIKKCQVTKEKNKNLPRKTTKIEAQIENVRINETDQRPYAEFCISVTKDGTKSKVYKQLKHFAQLHHELQQNFSNVPLPDQNLFLGINWNHIRPASIDQRRQNTQSYLDGLIKNQTITNSSAFQQFLELSLQNQEDVTPEQGSPIISNNKFYEKNTDSIDIRVSKLDWSDFE